MRITTIVCLRATHAYTRRLNGIGQRGGTARVRATHWTLLPFLSSELNRIDRDASKNYTPPMQTHFQEYPPPALPFLELIHSPESLERNLGRLYVRIRVQ